MKLIVLAVCLVQASLVASEDNGSNLHNLLRALEPEEIEKLVEVLLEENVRENVREQEARSENGDKLNFESRKRELMADSAALTEQVFENQRRAVANGKQSETGRLLKGYVKSTSYVQRISKMADRQLNMLNTFKRDWDEVYGKNGNNKGFWSEVSRTELLTKSSCTREDAESGSCLQSRDLIDICPIDTDPNCDKHLNSKTIYRSFDGSCTNLEEGQRWWGVAPSAQVRVLPSQYENGVSDVRVTGDSGATLPNPRTVSRVINNRFVHTPTSFSYFMMQFGQFLDHDLTHTDLKEVENDDGTTSDVVCSCDMEIDENSDCMIVNYENTDDPQVEAVGRQCLTMVRSAPFFGANCAAEDARQQVNSVTALVDCSQVYGSSKSFSKRLRDADTTRGKMDVLEHPFNSTWKALLPLLKNKEHKSDCHSDTILDDGTIEYQCFLAGDSRRNVQPGLAAFHTLWVRFHNYIEEELFAQNPSWDGETLFQEARRMVIAITQHITYNEYLKLLLGRTEWREEYPEYGGAKIEPDATERSQGVTFISDAHVDVYNSSVNPTIANVFSTAGYRFGHSEINDYVRFISKFQGVATECAGDNANAESQPETCVRMRELYNNPTTIYKSPAGDNVPGIDAIVLGILEEPSERVDLWYTEEITEYLFTDDPSDENTFGADLFALNVQRGRDHGLPGYMAYREHYGLETTDSWEQTPSWFNDNEWQKLSSIYADPWDIDVYPGGLLERHNNGAKTGDLFKKMMSDQFLRIKLGDRFWYEQGEQDWSFTGDQLVEIRSMTMSGLLCATLDFPGEIPQFAFEEFVEDGEDNLLLSCAEQPAIDFSKFQDGSKNPN